MDLSTLTDDVATYVSEELAGYEVQLSSGPKLIRDAVYGFQQLHPHEIAVLDTPLLQRLRGVHQTALSHLVYPSAHHTRFEHSIGVATKAEQMAIALREASSQPTVLGHRLLELRLAGLLHDVGHGLFSHLTESILATRHQDLVEEIKRHPDFAEKTNLGEALSALVVRSPAFADLLDKVKSAYPEQPHLKDVTAEGISELILGRTKDGAEQFLADIISGPFDADKLDYFGRDCHFTGIRAEVDWERITHALDVIDEDGRTYLAVWRSAVPNLEQVLFSKMMLFSAVYHHHKVRALEQMVHSTFDAAHANLNSLSEPLFGLQRLSDIWRLSEAEFFAIGERDPIVGNRVEAIRNRRLMQRALALNITTIKNGVENEDRYRHFQGLFALPNARGTALRLAKAVHEALPSSLRQSLDERDICFDFPKSPPLSDDAEQCKVLVDDGESRPLNNFFPTDDWVASYADNKLTCHVFASGNLEVRSAVADATQGVLRELYGIEIDGSARLALK